MVSIGFLKRTQRERETDHKAHSIKEWPDHIVTLERNSFNNFIEQYPLSIVDFWAPWCTPCNTMVPRLRRLSKIYKGKVAFGKLDTQNYQDIAQKYKIIGIPHLMFFRYGKKITSLIGVKSLGAVKNVIDDLLQNG